ncbi:MAG: multidrug efflux SMR transporter [Thermomicrobiales bacterium]
MSWVILVVSGLLEAVWATALGRSDGLSRPGPTTVFLLAVVLSMVGLATAMRSIPIGTAYAIWVGIGAVGTVSYGIVAGTETASPMRMVFLAGIVVCVAGLKYAQ